MKKLMVICTLICFAVSVPAMAQLKNMMMVGPYAGYTLGFGDRFDDVESSFGGFESRASADAGISFGGNFFYGVSDKFMIGGELMFQQYGYEFESNFNLDELAIGDSPSDYFASKMSLAQQEVSDSEMKITFLASALYLLTNPSTSMFLLNGGVGLYDHGESNPGIFAGVMWQKAIAATMSLFILPRVHYVFWDNSMFMLQAVVGLHFWLGNTGSPMSAS